MAHSEKNYLALASERGPGAFRWPYRVPFARDSRPRSAPHAGTLASAGGATG